MTPLIALAAMAVQQESVYVVHPYYLYPSDQPYHKEYVQAIEKTIVEVQDWYKKKVGLTFKLAPLQVKKGDEYAIMRGGPNPSQEVREDIQKMPKWWEQIEKSVGGYKSRRVYWIFAQGGGGFAGANLIKDHTGIAVFGDWVLEPISGVREPNAIHSGFATWQVEGGTPLGTTVHELGHAFGLHHPARDWGKSIMSWHGDYPDTGLLPHEIMILKESPFFVTHALDAGAPHLDFENADVMKWGETVTLSGKGFKVGDAVEFRDVKRSLRVKPELAEEKLRVVVPKDLGPGYIRVWRGGRRSNVVPVNFSE